MHASARLALIFTFGLCGGLSAAEGLPPDFKASMLTSLEKGSVTEIDFVNGSVLRWGQRWGVATPVNQALVAGIKGIEHRMARFAPR